MLGETTKRIMSAIVLIGAVIVALGVDTFDRVLILVFIEIFALLALNEIFTLSRRDENQKPHVIPGYIFGTLIILSFYGQLLSQMPGELSGPGTLLVSIFYPGNNLTVPLLIFYLFGAGVVQLLSRPLSGTLYSLGVTLLALCYAVLPLAHVFLYLTLSSGIFYLVLIVVITVLTDSGGYFCGRWFGKHKVGIKASPNKTYEGYLGGIFTALLLTPVFVGVYTHYFDSGLDFGGFKLIIFTLVTSTITILADLIESAIKRDAGQKDSGRTIPGHGGVLDLVDSMLFTIPVGYYLLLVFR